MTYVLNQGVIEKSGSAVKPEELYRLGSFDALDKGLPVKLVVSKRPIEIKFELQLTPFPHFVLYFKNAAIDQSQIQSLVNFGYLVSGHERIHFVSPRIRASIAEATGELPLQRTIKLVRSLYLEGLCEPPPKKLIDELNKRRERRAETRRLFIKTLYPYQKEGVDWLSFCTENGVGTILADDMGLGKTAQIIALCCDILEENSEARILVTIPNPLIDNWIREFNVFSPELKPYLHYGPNRRGSSLALGRHNIILTPYTTMTSDIMMLEELHFDLGIFDEASLLKNPSSARSIAARKLDIGVAVAMTGTPVENSLMDAWALADLVFPGYLGSEANFKSKYLHAELTQTLAADLSDLESSLRQITLRRMKKDVLTQLPDKLDSHVPISMNDKERHTYEMLIDQMKQDLRAGGSGMLPLINKLQQFTAHPALIDSTISHDVNSLSKCSAKFELLMIKLELIRSSNQKVIIFATFRKAIDLIQGAIQQRFNITPSIIDGRTPNNERQAIIDQFSSLTGFAALILHPKTAGVGLNITAATNVIHYSRQWNPALENQATARAWRNGQTSAVNVHYLFYANTIEEEIDERIRLKKELSDQVLTIAESKETDKKIMISYLEGLRNGSNR